MAGHPPPLAASRVGASAGCARRPRSEASFRPPRRAPGRGSVESACRLAQVHDPLDVPHGWRESKRLQKGGGVSMSVILVAPSGSATPSMNRTESASCRAWARNARALGVAVTRLPISAPPSSSMLIVLSTAWTASSAPVTCARLAGARGLAVPTAVARSAWLMRRFRQSRANRALSAAAWARSRTRSRSAAPCGAQSAGSRCTVRLSLPPVVGRSVSRQTRSRRSSHRTVWMSQVKAPPRAFSRATSSARENSSRNSSRRSRLDAQAFHRPWNTSPNSVPSSARYRCRTS